MIIKKMIRNIILKIIFAIKKDLDVTNKRLEFNMNLGKIIKEIRDVDRDQLGQLIRFYGHHLDKATKCENKSEGRGDERKRVLETAINEWRRRGYMFGPDKVWAAEILKRFCIWQTGEKKHIERVQQYLPINKDIFSVIEGRRSIRFWKNRLVGIEKVEKILSTTIRSPSSCNRMPWHFFVVENDLNNIVEGDGTNKSMSEKAPIIIYLGIDERLYPEVYAPALDAGIALQNIVLASHALGLGSCLMYQAESVDQDKLRAKLGAPNYYRIYCAVLMGYPAEEPIAPGAITLEEVSTFTRSN